MRWSTFHSLTFFLYLGLLIGCIAVDPEGSVPEAAVICMAALLLWGWSVIYFSEDAVADRYAARRAVEAYRRSLQDPVAGRPTNPGDPAQLPLRDGPDDPVG